jgi:2,5-diamino-6-(ribosylamino)-4(3H)-pyrimidinone 5'-phosphate reductase
MVWVEIYDMMSTIHPDVTSRGYLGMNNRPITTLFMLVSVDGKISTGASDLLDVDADFPKINGVAQGLHQYYEMERTTDLWSFNSGRVQAKIGVNTREFPNKSMVSFVVIDNKNLSEHGVSYFCALSKEFVLVTTNEKHPAFSITEPNLHIIYQSKLDLCGVLEMLYEVHSCNKITIQTGGTLNGLFLRNKLFDFVDIVLAPILIGGKETSTLIDGTALTTPQEIELLGALKLEQCDVLEDSYIRLRYKVLS